MKYIPFLFFLAACSFSLTSCTIGRVEPYFSVVAHVKKITPNDEKGIRILVLPIEEPSMNKEVVPAVKK